MAERVTARRLLGRARAVFDAPASGLADTAGVAWCGGFASGGRWMRQALEHLRGQALPGPAGSLHALGLGKYVLAIAAALACLGLASILRRPLLALLAVPAFYTVEAQMVFLFPVALDGSRRPLYDARRWTARAGGTLAVMRVVLPLACGMLLGGFLGRGFVRSWCLGCLAVCVWYEELRTSPAPLGGDRRMGLRFGASGPLLVREEQVALGIQAPYRILYASDLHLGHWWTAGVPGQLINVVREARPDIILLGGDLADSPGALPAVRSLVRGLTSMAPVYAVPGNHDPVAGASTLRDAVELGGGSWLPARPASGAVRIDGALAPASCEGPRVLCAHYPGIFPTAAAAGYRLVLAGHLHGGQCVLFTRRGRLYPAVWFHRWHGLRFAEGNSTLLVSRGAGDTLPLRFNCPREVILCVLS